MSYKPEELTRIFSDLKPDLEITKLNDDISRFGGHQLRVVLDGAEVDFWSEFIRVSKDSYRTMVFRVVSRLSDVNQPTHLSAIRNQLVNTDEKTVALLDRRSNLEREIEPGSKKHQQHQQQSLREAYRRLAAGDISFILTPVREASVGPTEKVDGIEPYVESRIKNDPHAWDIVEEIQIARMMHLISSGNASVEALQIMREQIAGKYKEFALPFCQFIESSLEELSFPELDTVISEEGDIAFFDDVEQSKKIDLGFGQRLVEQVIAYPWPTAQGTIYSRLFRVWDARNKEFEVVRVLQTQPNLDSIDGLRVDSSCVDGVHSLDCHCDCCIQLEAALYDYGLNEKKNIVVIQMADHEGKGWGTVLKGIGQHRLVRTYNKNNAEQPVNHIEAGAVFFDSLGMNADNRNYGAAQLVIKFLGITRVTEMLMDNQSKIDMVRGSGVQFQRKRVLYPKSKPLSAEAKAVINGKKNGTIIGADGQPVLYEGGD